jgi:hypothetical protein
VKNIVKTKLAVSKCDFSLFDYGYLSKDKITVLARINKVTIIVKHLAILNIKFTFPLALFQ